MANPTIEEQHQEIGDLLNKELNKWEAYKFEKQSRMFHNRFNEVMSLTKNGDEYQLLFAFMLGDTPQVSVEYRGSDPMEIFNKVALRWVD